MKLYNLISGDVEHEYSLIYRKFTYDMYALCKRYGRIVDFFDNDLDHYCDPQMDYNTPEELARFTLREVDLFVAVIGNESFYPRQRIDWALVDYYQRDKMYVLIFEDDEQRAAPISKNSLKYKLYFEEKMYPQSFYYDDELTFWIAIKIMVETNLSPDVIEVKDDLLFFEDVFIGYVSRIPALHSPIAYRNAKERGVDPDRIAVDIAKAVAFVIKIQTYRYHEQFRHIMDAQLRGDNIGVSLMINHETLCEEIEVAFEKYKTSKKSEDREEIEIILTKMELGVLNSYIINCADKNRDEYAAQMKKDINKHRNHLNKFKK